MIRQVDFQRCHGDMPLRRSMKIRTFGIVLDRASRADPIHGLATRALLGDDGLSGMTTPESTQLDMSDRKSVV